MQLNIENSKFIRDNILEENIEDESLREMITYMKIPVISDRVVTRVDNSGVALLIRFIKDYIAGYRNYSMSLRDKTGVNSDEDIKFVYTYKGATDKFTFCHIYFMAQIIFDRYFDKRNPKYKGYDTEKVDLSYIFDFMNFIKELDSKLISYYKKQSLAKHRDILRNSPIGQTVLTDGFSSLSNLFSALVGLLSIKERPFEIDDAVIFMECNDFLKNFLKYINDEDFEELYGLLFSMSTLFYEHIDIVNTHLKASKK